MSLSVCLYLCVVYFKGKNDTGPPQKKKKCKKKHFKEKGADEKKPNPKSQQKPPPSPAAPKVNGSKAPSITAPRGECTRHSVSS